MDGTKRNDCEPAKEGGRNRLAAADSPYLLQHADNPVDWYPWGEEAFDRARREDKPVFLSIGYSACHWCHVMERESFRDAEVAERMNRTFVSIKVDREERPDIDNVYMTVCQMLTGSGGWPLTVLLTPDKQPFYAATYIPRHARFGRPGMLDLVPQIAQIWRERRAEVMESAGRLTQSLIGIAPAGGDELGTAVLRKAYEGLQSAYDDRYGGFGTAPKFPTPHHFLFLLRHWHRTGAVPALEMTVASLRRMARSGTFDQLEFGFHRYATDREWKVPHFEKMLYDQALLLLAYVEAHQASGDETLAVTARRICLYVRRRLTADAGGFYSAENAESEGEEGKFYVWRWTELNEVLDDESLALAADAYGLNPGGNLEAPGGETGGGANVLHRAMPLDELAARRGMPRARLDRALDSIRERLAEARARRVRPSLDDKILADWNGLMIAALARAGRVLAEPDYVCAAERAAAFVGGRMVDDSGGLLHRFRQGRAGIAAHADDYAFLIWGLLELYEATFDVAHLKAAKQLQAAFDAHFWDRVNGGYCFTSDRAGDLPVRRREIYDGAVPSANSVAMLNLLRLGHLTGSAACMERAAALGRAFAGSVRNAPQAHTMLLTAVDFALGPAGEVVIATGGDEAGTQAMFDALRGMFLPRTVMLLRPPGDVPPIASLAPFTLSQTAQNGKATAYVCANGSCRRPTTDPDDMLKQLADQGDRSDASSMA